MKIGYNWLNIIQKNLLPPTCILCGHAGMADLDLCAPCLQHLPSNLHPCRQCAQALPIDNYANDRCKRCRQFPPAYDRSYAPYLHQGAARHLVTALKFNGHYKNARLLGNLLAAHLKKQQAPLPEVIVPIPLHKTRYRERGFNQCIEIARTVSKDLNLPLDLDACLRNRDTPHQTALPAKQRRNNIKQAFSTTKPMTNLHIAVIDDVMTTGATTHELATALKLAGARQVDAWIFARA